MQCSFKSYNLCDLAISLAYPSQELGGLLLVVPMYMVITTRHTAPCALDYTCMEDGKKVESTDEHVENDEVCLTPQYTNLQPQE